MASIDDRKTHAEEEYFQRQERELRERVRYHQAQAEARAGLAEAAGVADESVLTTLADLGFDRDTVAVLHLFPLVVVAWADGELAAPERDAIQRAAAARGVSVGTPAGDRLAGWLAEAPSAAFTERALGVIRAVSGTSEQDGDLVALCRAVAGAAGGFLGFSKISAEEEAAIAKVAASLAEAHGDAASRIVR